MADKVNKAVIKGSLHYEYKFTDHPELYFNVSNILSKGTTELEIKNTTIIPINKNNTYYFRKGILSNIKTIQYGRLYNDKGKKFLLKGRIEY